MILKEKVDVAPEASFSPLVMSSVIFEPMSASVSLRLATRTFVWALSLKLSKVNENAPNAMIPRRRSDWYMMVSSAIFYSPYAVGVFEGVGHAIRI